MQAAIWGLFTAVTIASLLGAALSPYLLVKSPLLLVAISAAAHHVALAAASVDQVPLIVVATVRRVLTGLSAYGLGYLYGGVAIAWIEQRHPRLGDLVRWVQHLFARFGVALLIIAPAPTIALFAGAARSRLSWFLLALTLGHLFWNTVTQYLGDVLARRTEMLTAFLGEHLFESTAICVTLVVVQQAVSRWRRRPHSVP